MNSEDLAFAWRRRGAGGRSRYERTGEVSRVGGPGVRKGSAQRLGGGVRQSSYDWMARRRGLWVARAVALLNAAGSGSRLALYSGLAALRPARFASARESYRHWTGVHSVGLRRRSRQLRRG